MTEFERGVMEKLEHLEWMIKAMHCDRLRERLNELDAVNAYKVAINSIYGRSSFQLDDRK